MRKRPSEISDGLCFILILRYQHNIKAVSLSTGYDLQETSLAII